MLIFPKDLKPFAVILLLSPTLKFIYPNPILLAAAIVQDLNSGILHLRSNCYLSRGKLTQIDCL